MNYVAVSLLLVLGFLGAIQLIAARKPSATALAKSLAPHQGWIGVVGFVLGVVYLVRMLLHGWFDALGIVPVSALTSLAGALLLIGLGAIFGLALMKKFSKAGEKLDALVARIRPIQSTLGVAALGVGAWMLVQSVLGLAI
jgi:hypothetical protein